MRSLWMTLAATLALATHAPYAGAQPASSTAPRKHQPNPKELDEARAHFKAAEAAKARGEYRTAAVEYLAAYQLFEEPEFFFDTAEVYRLGGDEPNALTYYEKYLELDPSGRGATAARANADQLRRSIAVKQDAARRAAEDEITRRTADDPERKPEPAPVAAPPAPHPPEPAAMAARPGRGLRMAGIAAGGAGVVALGAGAFFGLKAQSISKELSNAEVFDRARFDQGKAAERNMVIFTSLGAASIAAGGVLYYLGHRAGQIAETDPHTAVTIAPVVERSQITFIAAGHF